ncbi:hypothetical protein B0H10DRAFT_1998499 [Mycena sp. CBHHK59/15]|nr:hypothetical protein B0H10DRAFT_1998499 [Mycena sp. CBHHK59/15]
MSSSRTHKLRRGTVIYATGFLVTHPQMQAISRSVCDDDFLARYGHELILALKWRANEFKYEILPTKDNDRASHHLFAIKFFPYLKDVPATASIVFSRLCSLSNEQKNAWHETFGKHTGVPLDDYEQITMRYPTNGAAADFLQQQLQEVINADCELWELLEPIVPRRAGAVAFTSVYLVDLIQPGSPCPPARPSCPMVLATYQVVSTLSFTSMYRSLVALLYEHMISNTFRV